MDMTLVFPFGKKDVKIYGAVHVGYIGGGFKFGQGLGFDTPSIGVGGSFSIDFEQKE